MNRRHTTFAPAPTITDSVKCFWILEESQSVFNSDDVLPDSYSEVIINCGAPFRVETPGGWAEVPQVFLNRLQNKPVRFYASGPAQFVAVRLHPWAARAFLDDQTDLAATSVVPLSGLWQKLGKTVQAELRRGSYREAVACMSQFLSDYYRLDDYAGPIQEASKMLHESGGQMRVADLAARFYLSASQFERRFKHLTGVSVKTYARLVRFEAVRNHLWMNPAARATDLVSDFGFTDQAHLIHEFKALTNLTPGKFSERLHTRVPTREDARFLQYA
jgi:AraC-like DNA-binding protein